MNNLEHLHRELRDAKEQVKALNDLIDEYKKHQLYMIGFLMGCISKLKRIDGDENHNKSIDDLRQKLGIKPIVAEPIIVYGHDCEPSMAVDSATLEVHDEY